MNWEAFLVIGAFTVILGIVLLVPGLIWARRKAKRHPEKHPVLSITRAGYLLLISMLLVLLVGLTSQLWAPHSLLGQWTATRAGRFLFACFVIVVAIIIERILAASGIELKGEVDKK